MTELFIEQPLALPGSAKKTYNIKHKMFSKHQVGVMYFSVLWLTKVHYRALLQHTGGYLLLPRLHYLVLTHTWIIENPTILLIIIYIPWIQNK